MARLSISLLGPFRVTLEGRPLTTFESDKVRALLAYLALEAGTPHRREALAGLLWPEHAEREARHNLSQALYNLRAALVDCQPTSPLLAVTRQAIRFDRSDGCWLDAAAFTTLLDEVRAHAHPRLAACEACRERLEQAVALYRGEFLAGFSLGDSAPFEEWMLLQQERFHRLAVDAMRCLAECCEQCGTYEQGLVHARRWAELEPWQEDAHRQLMRLLALNGDRSAALAQYEACCRTLEEELDVEPSAETRRLYERIRDGQDLSGSDAHADAGPSAGKPDRSTGNLPAQLIPLVGREKMLAEIDERLRDPGSRLLTLVGPGGSGKTRLALEAAARQVDHFADGAWFVPLASLQSAEAIVPTVAQAIGFAFYSGGEPKDQLLNYLRSKDMLLVLDNYEHLLEGAELTPEILRAAPEVVVLATSRAALNVQGESLYLVSGMDYPALTPPALTPDPSPADRRRSVGGRGELADVAQYSAVRLFADSARRARPDFRLTSDNLPDVVRICRLVDGMPLALLLAAAWLKVLAPAEIANQITGQIDPALGPESGRRMTGLDFLASDLRGVPERQRSMRAVFSHSWSLLPEGQQAMMEALSVFRGGCTREAAQEVAGASLRDLLALVDRSLLHRDAPSRDAPSRGSRFAMHELLRQYAAEKLALSPFAYQAARDAHCAYNAAALARWAADLKGPRQQAALAEMAVEIDNVRAAWTWAVHRQHVERLGQAMEGLGWLYKEQVLYGEAESAFRVAAGSLVEWTNDLPCPKPRGVVSGPPGTPAGRATVRAFALAWQAYFCRRLGRSQEARDLLRQSLDIMNALAPADTRQERAFALYVLGEMEGTSGNIKAACQPLTQSLALYRALDRRWEMAEILSSLADVAQGRGEFDQAKELRQEGLVLRRELGDQRGLLPQLFALAITFRSLGQSEEFERWGQEGLAIARDVDDRDLTCRRLKHMAAMLEWKGEFAESRLVLEECVRVGREMGAGLYWMYYASQRALGLGLAHLGHYKEARAHLQQALALAQEANSSYVIGSVFHNLGLVELAEGNPIKARRHLQKGVAVMREMGRRCNVSWFHAALAGAARGVGQLSEARTHLCEALQQSGEMRDLLTPLYILPVAALLLADWGDVERAVDIYALASRYGFVANSRLWEDIAGRHIAALAATLPPELVAAAQERGRARDLWATAKELLDEM